MFISGNLRASGSLVALAIGDALGAPLEGSPQPGAWVTDMLPGGRHFRKKGQTTDDTDQAVAVAESLLSMGGFDENDLLLRLAAGFYARPEWYGPTSTAFFTLIRSGVMPQRAVVLAHKRSGQSRSNGSVMRGPPIGIFYRVPEVYAVSLACSHLTHLDPAAAHCSAFLNVMISDICRGKTRAAAFRRARSLCTHPEVHAVLGNYADHPQEASPDAVLCSHAALSCFMDSRSLEKALLAAINLGGDADTVGACCGALSGAFWGFNAIPQRWMRDLCGCDGIRDLGERLWICSEHSARGVRDTRSGSSCPGCTVSPQVPAQRFPLSEMSDF